MACIGIFHHAVRADGRNSVATPISLFVTVLMRLIMPITNSSIYAGDRSFKRPPRLSGLAITASVEDLSFLESRFKEAHWKLCMAGTYRQAMAELSQKRLPVVLSDCQLPDGNWKDVLSRLALMLERPRLIVFSRHANDRLWAEVLNSGGFDLLATPFREEELVFAIGSAWLNWESEQESRRLRKSAHT
jgi:CheY-like chemotaxis protein